MVICFLVGTDLESAFVIKVRERLNISDLKEIIYEKNKKDFKNFDANKLNLWKVDIPGDTENVKLKTLQSRSRDMGKENITIQELGGRMLTAFTLYNDFDDIFVHNSNNIRIIVQPPLFTGKCLLIFYFSKKKMILLFCFLYNVLITFVSAFFVLGQGFIDISRCIAELGYLPRQSTYKLVFLNYNACIFLTVTSL
jgi:hypothetical protein